MLYLKDNRWFPFHGALQRATTTQPPTPPQFPKRWGGTPFLASLVVSVEHACALDG